VDGFDTLAAGSLPAWVRSFIDISMGGLNIFYDLPAKQYGIVGTGVEIERTRGYWRKRGRVTSDASRLSTAA
jgi:hypothetical protein